MQYAKRIKKNFIEKLHMGLDVLVAYDKRFTEFTDALLVKGLGPRTIQALALVSEVIYGAPSRFSDPARFSFAHGGKDGHPAPVPLKVYDKSIGVLKSAVRSAKLGNSDKLGALKKLDCLVRHIENNYEPQADVKRLIAHERRIASLHGGRTVFDGKHNSNDVQLKLF